MKTSEQKKKEALERQAEYNKLTPAQKLLKLDITFGEGKGAKNERAKLLLLQVKEANSQGQAIPGVGNQRPQKKPYQKPKKS